MFEGDRIKPRTDPGFLFEGQKLQSADTGTMSKLIPDGTGNASSTLTAPGQLAGERSEERFSNHATLVAGVMVAANEAVFEMRRIA